MIELKGLNAKASRKKFFWLFQDVKLSHSPATLLHRLVCGRIIGQPQYLPGPSRWHCRWVYNIVYIRVKNYKMEPPRQTLFIKYVFSFFELFRPRLALTLAKKPTNFSAKIWFGYHKNAAFDDEFESIKKCKKIHPKKVIGLKTFIHRKNRTKTSFSLKIYFWRSIRLDLYLPCVRKLLIFFFKITLKQVKATLLKIHSSACDWPMFSSVHSLIWCSDNDNFLDTLYAFSGITGEFLNAF